MGYGLDDPGSILGRGKVFYLSHSIQPALGPTESFTQRIPGAISLSVKLPRSENDY
jgi:hypothetical protein